MAKIDEVEKGQVWRVRWHDGSFTEVEITGVTSAPVRSNYYPYNVTGSKRRFTARNLKTGRPVVIKSAAKLRELVLSSERASARAAGARDRDAMIAKGGLLRDTVDMEGRPTGRES